jgi:hypothetical protein
MRLNMPNLFFDEPEQVNVWRAHVCTSFFDEPEQVNVWRAHVCTI